jgi:FtsZ-interacting cell division protein ZipA
MNVIFSAVVQPFDTSLPRIKATGPALREWGILLGAILVIATIVILWIVFSGKSRRHAARRDERRQRRRAFRRAAAEAEQRSEKSSGRRRRRHHRPRNPTLAETGGLPPIRGDDQQPQVPPH